MRCAAGVDHRKTAHFSMVSEFQNIFELLFIFLLTMVEQTFIMLIYQSRTNVYKASGSHSGGRIYRRIQVVIMKTRHLKIVNPVRFFIFVLICSMLIIFAGYSLIGAGQAEAATVNTYKQVVIHEGDNLWDIVEKYNPDVHKSYTQIVHDIEETNDVDANSLQPGDMIFVPIY